MTHEDLIYPPNSWTISWEPLICAFCPAFFISKGSARRVSPPPQYFLLQSLTQQVHHTSPHLLSALCVPLTPSWSVTFPWQTLLPPLQTLFVFCLQLFVPQIPSWPASLDSYLPKFTPSFFPPSRIPLLFVIAAYH